ncbi:hypothetical protein [Sphingomonas faeni]|uniref:hypothetical protein n=1 Tax=Sphingomonas faeni TaxID=185950 RepID=UPI00278A7342|nr:hypothetical protein [Sphingomonas faeni]MDQ0840317.1 hypothetical protein [Sphingomonas faeni]
MSDVISVFTSKSMETILADGGSQSWALDRSRAARCDYLVACRNAHGDAEGPEPHRQAFLVGKVADVVASTDTDGRFKIVISEFAEVSWEDGWEEGRRNPVAYYKDHDFTDDDGKPMDFKALPFKKLDTAPRGLSLAEAKAGLAVTFGVPESAIEVTIRA